MQLRGNLWRPISMDKSQSRPCQPDRINERGAALIITLLVATALLVAGGALIQITSMSARNAIDSTAEAQAYYGAEAGVQAALNALRDNATPTASAMPAGMTGMSFRNAVTRSSSNDCPSGSGGDTSTVPRLSRWLPYSNRQTAGTHVIVGTNPTVQYDVEVLLPPGDTLPAGTAEPKRLLIQSTGYGPNGAMKKMSMIVAKNPFDATAPAMMTLIGTPGGSPAMDFDSGNSAKHVYSGADNAGVVSGLPAFGVTNSTDLALASNSAGNNTTSDPKAAVLSGSSIPSYLQSPAAARTFLDQMQAAAIAGQAAGTATYLPNGGSGTPTGFTFVKGDYTMGTGSGSGLLIVTGDLTTNGNTNFSGLILVIGNGSVNRNGGGGGYVYGATLIASVDWPVAQGATPNTNFGAPYFNFNGAGNATMQYDSSAIDNALQTLPGPVLGVSEY
jgi:Tfp pilus assembly protein PilX